ncbi:lysozyme [Pantoea sp. Acro-805]|jgi:lysozyme|uniref:Lysozyme n=1 Tax=Candidatus Pantoea formicae TaxID=2608355 RepID=A0ABX0QZK1_9GAMM|nr:lysozyme [Pantoea formicae]MDF7651896.1 lysozyme [Erwiniaceae bacterium L1_54_3]NIF02398.1 lysozyme [Pantoea formicae]
MAISPSLRKRLLAIAGAGAFTIAATLLGGKNGLEGRRYTPYRDVAGALTVCDGHTGADIVKGKTYTESDCDRLLNTDLKEIQQGVDSLVQVPLHEYERAALYSFAYNIGLTAFASSTLLKKLNAGDDVGARKELHRWVFAGGKKRTGLINRREIEFWLSGVKDGPSNQPF